MLSKCIALARSHYHLQSTLCCALMTSFHIVRHTFVLELQWKTPGVQKTFLVTCEAVVELL